MQINGKAPVRLIIASSIAAGFLTIAGCKAKDAQPANGTTAATSSASSASSNDVSADAAALASYPLTTEKVAKVTQVMQTIKSLEKSDPALKAQWDAYAPDDDAKSVDEAIDRMNSAPRAPEILKSAGISAHDFIYTTFALMYASMGYELKKAGRPMPPGTFGTRINPANIEFVASHQAEIKALNDASSDSDGSDDNN